MPRDNDRLPSNPPLEPELELDDEAPLDDADPSEPPAPELVPEPAKVEGPKRTPEQWAERLGHVNKARPHIPQTVTHPDWQHAAADKAHGWSKHAYHYQADPLLITQDDYEKALAAAAEYPNVPLHEPALSPLLKPKEAN